MADSGAPVPDPQERSTLSDGDEHSCKFRAGRHRSPNSGMVGWSPSVSDANSGFHRRHTGELMITSPLDVTRDQNPACVSEFSIPATTESKPLVQAGCPLEDDFPGLANEKAYAKRELVPVAHAIARIHVRSRVFLFYVFFSLSFFFFFESLPFLSGVIFWTLRKWPCSAFMKS